MTDDPARAYAILGLAQGTSLPEVRRRYLLLAKRWHPDRFAGDPAAETLAEERMRAFNGAYHTLVGALAQPPAGPPAPSRPPGQRLSRDEIERFVASMNAPGPIDAFLTDVGWVGTRVQAALAALFVIAVVLRVSYLLLTGQFAQLMRDITSEPRLAFGFAVLIFIGIAENGRRAELREHERSMPPARQQGRITTG